MSGAEQSLSARQRDLRLTIDTIPALVWSTGADGSVDFVNQHYLDYVGLPSEHLMDGGWTAAVHPDDLSGLTTIWRSLIASGKSGEAEARFRRADGEYRWLLLRANPLHDGNGNIVKWYGLNADMEDRRHMAPEQTGANTPAEWPEEAVFEIVNQLDRGAGVITSMRNGSNWRNSSRRI